MTIKLIKQSFKENVESYSLLSARNKDFDNFGLNFENLELICMVSGTSSKVPFTQGAINEVNDGIVKEAERLGASYVFGVEYMAMYGNGWRRSRWNDWLWRCI